MSPALGTNGGRSKSTTVFMHFCIECNGKTLKVDTIAKSVTNTGNAFLYGLQKYDLKYGLSVHIKIKGRFKSQFYMQNTIFS